MVKPREISGIREAVSFAVTQTNLADMLGVSKVTVGKWVRRGYVPTGRIDQIHDLFGIKRSRLCNPKLFQTMREREEEDEQH